MEHDAEVRALMEQVQSLTSEIDKGRFIASQEATAHEHTRRNLQNINGEIARLRRVHTKDERALVKAHAEEVRALTERHYATVARVLRVSDSADLEEAFLLIERACEVYKDIAGGATYGLSPDRCVARVNANAAVSVAPKPLTSDDIRSVCTSNGASECTVYRGPGNELTIVVLLRRPAEDHIRKGSLSDIVEALTAAGLHPADYTIREVRSRVDLPVTTARSRAGES
jgi:hypothetical protein